MGGPIGCSFNIQKCTSEGTANIMGISVVKVNCRLELMRKEACMMQVSVAMTSTHGMARGKRNGQVRACIA